MNFRRSPILCISQISTNKLMSMSDLFSSAKIRQLLLLLKHLTSELCFIVKVSGEALSEQQLSASFDEKRRYFCSV